MEDSIADNFIEELVKLMSSRKVGNPEDKSVFQGPQGDQGQRDRIVSLFEQGGKDGEVLCGGKGTSVNGKV